VKQLVAITFMTVLVAGTLAAADRIAHVVGTGDNRRIETLRDITVTGWSAQEVQYRGAGGSTGSVQTRNVLTLERNRGSMNRGLSDAILLVGSEPEQALERLNAIIADSSISAIDREEAGFWRLQVYVERAGASGAALTAAIRESQGYLRQHRTGFFARDVNSALYNMQLRAGNASDARTTLRNMSEASPALRREANQWLGELEANAGNWEQALRAFQAARSAAQRDQNKSGEYLAQAWEGWSLHRNGESSSARSTLETITADREFEDPFSSDGDVAMAIAFMALGDVHFDAGNFERAYNAYIRGAYHNFWIESPREGYCLAQAFTCARRLEGSDAKWRTRRESLRTALAVNFPRELQRVE
jgi:tetratricopeptide (TPR) repeat protein